MAKHLRFAASLIAGSLVVFGMGVAARAASASTDAFVAAVRPNVDILDRTSRIALDNSKNPRLRSFAHREAVEQTIAANSLVAWSQTNTLAGAEVALGRPLAPPPALPVDAALAGTPAVFAEASVAAQGVVTGRSVAIDNPATDRPLTVTRAAGPTLVAPDASVLTRLSALKGAAFDTQYLSVQRVSLGQLSMLYGDYMRNGDDPALRALATRERPKIIRRLAELPQL